MCLQNSKVLEKLYILAVAVIVLLFCSQCSPLYVTNRWWDPNIYFTIGRGMAEGKLVYVDLYDHKGPIIYFFHAIAALVSNQSFIGIWFLEIVCVYFSLYYAYKTIKLFIKEEVLALVPVTALIVYTSNTFCAGDSAEELCLPFLAYCLYVGMKAINQNAFISRKESLLVGISLGYVFWLKFTMVGFFIGFALYFLIDSFKRNIFKQYATNFGVVILGFMLLTMPIFAYFIAHNSLDALFKVYFIDNLFTYNKAGDFAINGIKSNLSNGLFSITYYFHIGLLFIFLGWHYLLNYEKKKLVIFNISCFLFLFLSSFGGGRTYNYYSFVFSVFIPLGMCMIHFWIKDKVVFISKTVLVGSLLMCCCSGFLTGNKAYIFERKENCFLEPFAKIITQKDNVTLINYNVMDMGLYTYCGIIPQYRYFSLTNIRTPEIDEGIRKYIKDEKVDFIFTIKDYSFDGYSIVYAQDFYEHGQMYQLCLYKRNDLKL